MILSAIYSLTLSLAAPNEYKKHEIEDFAVGEWVKRDGQLPKPPENILLCSDEIDFYKRSIVLFDKIYGSGKVHVLDGRSEVVDSSKPITWAFIGDPKSDIALECLSKYNELKERVNIRVQEYDTSGGYPDLPLEYRQTLPFKLQKTACSTAFEYDEKSTEFFISISWGKLNCSMGVVPSLFSFERSEQPGLGNRLFIDRR